MPELQSHLNVVFSTFYRLRVTNPAPGQQEQVEAIFLVGEVAGLYRKGWNF